MATYNLIIGTNVNWVYKDLETLNILTLEVRSLMQQLGEVFQNAISDKTQHRKFSRIYVVLLAINMIFFLRHRSPTILSNTLNFTMKINLNLQNQWEKTYITYIQNDLNLSKIFPHQTMVISFYYTHMCVWALIQCPAGDQFLSSRLSKISTAYVRYLPLISVPKSPDTANFRLPPPPPPAFLPFYWTWTPGPQKASILVTFNSSITSTVPTHGAFDLDFHKCNIAAQSHSKKSANTENTSFHSTKY